jgi:hypothetical protein
MFFDAPEPIPSTAMIGVPLSAIRDGTSNTILVLESGRNNGVPWTSPQELTVDIDEAIDGLREAQTNHAGVRMTLLGDGSVRTMPNWPLRPSDSWNAVRSDRRPSRPGWRARRSSFTRPAPPLRHESGWSRWGP